MESNENIDRLIEIVDWIKKEYPTLVLQIKWSQPMFIMEDTYVIGFSLSKKHISVGPEKPIMEQFKDQIENNGYKKSTKIFTITSKQEVDYSLLKLLIEETMKVKKGYEKFWM
jgi:uncharacterized protein YdhG (YjbR/CyaY superfamily)